jgi:uncharacterized membrane protein YbhN (UPF0104 family)
LASATTRSALARSVLAWARAAGGVGILVLLVWRVGTGPFLDGIRVIDGTALAAALGIGALVTVCCAWRWSLVAAGLGVRLPLGEAVAAYYRSQFLNTTLPGGVLGDVHRAVRHGLDISDVRLAARAVILERFAGTVVQFGFSGVVLCVFPSPIRAHMPVVVLAAVAAGLALALVARAMTARWVRALRADLRSLRAGGAWLPITVASAVVVAGHLATFLLAARTAGSAAPLLTLMPLTQLALLAMVLPFTVAGWGPREGVAAWAFAAAGMTATQGVTAAVTYGVLVLMASLPGAVVLLVRWLGWQRGLAMPEVGHGDAHG